MPLFLDAYGRLEPTSPVGNLDEGFAARTADPAWFLGRQWQLGEHQGEDAGSPVLVHYDVVLSPLRDTLARDAVHAPTEALVEAAPHQWWTPARRVREGRRVMELAAATPELLDRLKSAHAVVKDLPPPYDFLNDRAPDGLSLYLQRAGLGLPPACFADLPPEATRPKPEDDAWDPARFEFQAALYAGAVELRVRCHDGGRIDWFACEAHPSSAEEPPLRESGISVPGRLDYAGAPVARWWQLEERQFDVGGFHPDRSHFATLLLIDLVSSHADDWFLVPIDTKTPGLGHLLTIETIQVMDSFGETYRLDPPGKGWTLFEVDGLGTAWSLPLLPTVSSPLIGSPLDEVEVTLDDDANLVWAREHRIAGRETRVPDAPVPRTEVAASNAQIGQRYDPTSALQPYWHPYVLASRRKYAQARLADYSSDPPTLLPEPRSDLLYDARAAGGNPAHTIDASAITELGLRLETRHVLARGSNGRPHLWLQRRRFVRPRHTSRTLAFDVLRAELPPPSQATALGNLELRIMNVVQAGARNGVTDAVVSVQIIHRGKSPLLNLGLIVEHGSSPCWSPAVHDPARVARLLPGETLAVDLAVAIPDQPYTSDLRVTLTQLAGPGAPWVSATSPITPLAPATTPNLRVEVTGPVVLDGAVASAPLRLRVALPDTDVDAVELELRGDREVTWTRIEGWRTSEAEPDGDGWSVSVRVTWNAWRYPGTTWIRPRLRQLGTAGVEMGAPVVLGVVEVTDAMSPRLSVNFGIREVRPTSTGCRALAVLILHNTGDEDLNDVTIAFEQRHPAAFGWHSVPHEQATGNLRVDRGEQVAAPVLIDLEPSLGALIVRARIYSVRWALSETLTVLNHTEQDARAVAVR